MPTSTARISDRTPGFRGFTLIELIIVLVLLSVAMSLTVPAFQSLLQGQAQREANRLAGVIRLLRNEAVLGRTTFRLMLDMKEGRYVVDQQTASGSFAERTEPSMLRPHTFPAALKLKALIMFGQEVSREGERPVPIVIDAAGFVDPFLLQFSDAGKPYTLKVVGYTGHVKLVEGYVDK